MKNLFKINSILIMCLFMISGTVSAKNNDPNGPLPTKDNILIVKGDIFNDAAVNIVTFYYDNDKCCWHRYNETTTKKKYSMLLDPTLDYQIWYQDNQGNRKIMYIEKGIQGTWQCQVNLDFEIKHELFAHMYQSPITDDFYEKFYAIEGIDLRKSEEILSYMENPCIDEILYSEE